VPDNDPLPRRLFPLWVGVYLCAIVAGASVLVMLASLFPSAATWSETLFG
jgi:hypothetical protein